MPTATKYEEEESEPAEDTSVGEGAGRGGKGRKGKKAARSESTEGDGEGSDDEDGASGEEGHLFEPGTLIALAQAEGHVDVVIHVAMVLEPVSLVPRLVSVSVDLAPVSLVLMPGVASVSVVLGSLSSSGGSQARIGRVGRGPDQGDVLWEPWDSEGEQPVSDQGEAQANCGTLRASPPQANLEGACAVRFT